MVTALERIRYDAARQIDSGTRRVREIDGGTRRVRQDAARHFGGGTGNARHGTAGARIGPC